MYRAEDSFRQRYVWRTDVWGQEVTLWSSKEPFKEKNRNRLVSASKRNQVTSQWGFGGPGPPRWGHEMERKGLAAVQADVFWRADSRHLKPKNPVRCNQNRQWGDDHSTDMELSACFNCFQDSAATQPLFWGLKREASGCNSHCTAQDME